MTNRQLSLAEANTNDIQRLIEQTLAGCNLHVTLRGTLRTQPGSVHWHVRPPGEKRGTLELILLPAKHTLWLKVAANRNAAWVARAAAQLEAKLKTVNALA